MIPFLEQFLSALAIARRSIGLTRTTFFRVIVIITLLAALTPRAVAKDAPFVEGDKVDLSQMIVFADSLYERGEHLRALNFYEFYLSLKPEADEADGLHLKIGLCYQGEKRWDDAAHAFEEVVEGYPASDVAAEASYRIGQTFFLSGNYFKAVQGFLETGERFPSSRYGHLAEYSAAVSYAMGGAWEESSETFEGFYKQNPEHPLAEQSANLSEYVLKGDSLPRRSPFVARLLSAVIPGLGQAYCTHYGDAIMALLVNGTVGFLTYDAFTHDREVAGALFSLAGVSFFGGNVYGGGRSAERFNENQRRRFSQKAFEAAANPLLELSLEF
jgi:tetratricopeptide (TPR) repeat protein